MAIFWYIVNFAWEFFKSLLSYSTTWQPFLTHWSLVMAYDIVDLGHGLTWIPAWINDNIYYKVWDEIMYPFPNFSGITAEGSEWISNYTHILLGMWLLIHAGIKVKSC